MPVHKREQKNQFHERAKFGGGIGDFGEFQKRPCRGKTFLSEGSDIGSFLVKGSGCR